MATTIDEVKARFGQQDLLALVREAGKKVAGSRCQCPLDCCVGKGTDSRLNAVVLRSTDKWVLYCHLSGTRADFLDVYQRVRGVPLSVALEELAGRTPAPAPIRLRPVHGAAPSTDDKRKPAEVLAVWNGLAESDAEGQAYLEGRALSDTAGFVRFATEDSSNPEVKGKADSGFRVGMLLSDVTGTPRGIQFRTVASGAKDKMRSLARGMGKHVFFGEPGRILEAATVVVAEGMADTLTALQWARGKSGVVVVGAPGFRGVEQLGDALGFAGVDVSGRTFLLLAQHDRGPTGNTSLRAMGTLGARLTQMGAYVVTESSPPGDAKDWAEAHQKRKLPEWPPPVLQRLLEAVEPEAEEKQARVGAIWQEREPNQPEAYGKNLSTLQWLLFDEAHRKDIAGPGDWEWNELTGLVEYGRRPLVDADYTSLRLGLERYKGMDQKALKFAGQEVREVAGMLARLKPYHPVREYLGKLEWKGQRLLHEGLPAALGLDAATQGLEAEYVRRWLIAAVARAMRPGCQVDTMLVLQGPQGVFKSSFFRELGGAHYATLSTELGSAASIEVLRQAWVVELDEMDAIKRTREASSVTAFLTRTEDVYNAKWVREAVRVPRSSVFGGTTNDKNFLTDTTGSRRFWVVPVTKAIDIGWVRQHRDQLWAEAVVEYRAGQPWQLEAALEALRGEANQAFEERHPWFDLLAGYLARGHEAVTTTQLMSDPLQLPSSQMTTGAARAVSGVLRQLGWEQVIEGDHHVRTRVWRKAIG